MRIVKLAGLAAVTAALSGALIAPATAQASPRTCYAGASGATASGGCYGAATATWRLVADCYDTSSIKWPVRVGTLTTPFVAGVGHRSLECAPGLKADGHLEYR